MEKSGLPKLGVSGRHIASGKLPSNGEKTIGKNVGRFKKFWDGGKPKEIPTNTDTGSGTFGFYSGFQTRNIASSKRKAQSNKERVGKTFDPLRNVVQKNGCNFGGHKVLSNGNAFFEGIHRPAGAVCKPARNFGLGSKSSHSFPIATASQGNALSHGKVAGQKISGKDPSKGTTFRFLPNGMGWGGCDNRVTGSRILERTTGFAHKRERIGGSDKYRQIPSKGQGACLPKSRQFSDFLLPDKAGGKDPKFKPNGQAIFALVHGKSSHPGYSTGEKFRRFSRCPQQMGTGQGGLHPKQKSFSVSTKEHGSLHHTNSGHVCIPRKSPTEKVCLQIPPLASSGGRCSEMSFAKLQSMLCKPPLESHWPMATQTKRKQAPAMHANSPILGFKSMVAPNSETARQGDPKFSDKTISWDVQKLLGRVHALSTLAPRLYDCIRKGLQAKQVSFEAQDTYLKGLKSIQRYNAYFKLFTVSA
jgi:hypothetical protein